MPRDFYSKKIFFFFFFIFFYTIIDNIFRLAYTTPTFHLIFIIVHPDIREVIQVYSGELPEVRIQTSCRCPPTHPRIRPLHTRYCIRNGVPDNTGDEVLRLANFSHPLEYLNDGDFNSYWVSAFLDDVTIEVNLGDQFQV